MQTVIFANRATPLHMEGDPQALQADRRADGEGRERGEGGGRALQRRPTA